MRVLLVAQGEDFKPLRTTLEKLKAFDLIDDLPKNYELPDFADLGVPAKEPSDVHWIGHGNAKDFLSHEEKMFSLDFSKLNRLVPGITPGVEIKLKRCLDIENDSGQIIANNLFKRRAAIKPRIARELTRLLGLKTIKQALRDAICNSVSNCIVAVGTHKYYPYELGALAAYLLRTFTPHRLFFWACNIGQNPIANLKEKMLSAIAQDAALRDALPDVIELSGPTSFMNQMSIKALLIPFLTNEKGGQVLEYKTRIKLR